MSLKTTKVMTVAGAAALRLACLPPEAMVATKRLLKTAYMSGLSEQRKLEEEAASHLEGSAESKEAFSAFHGKTSAEVC